MTISFSPLNFSLLLIIIAMSSCQMRNQDSPFQETYPLSESPGPSDEDDPNRDSLKQAYFDELYYADEGVDVEAIRAANHRLNLARKEARKTQANLRSGSESFANNKITAEWHERGPDNEAGDVREVIYMPANDDIYVLSTVGHLWKGNLDGLSWTLLDDSKKFDTNILHALPHGAGVRLFACYGSGNDDKEVRYSDDEGQTWTQGTGFSFYDHWGSARRFYSLSDDNTLYYLAHTWSGSPWGEKVSLYVSTDKGVSYTNLWNSPVGYKKEDVDLWKPHDSDNLYLIDNRGQDFYEVTHDFGTATGTVSAPISYTASGVTVEDVYLTGRYNSTISDYEFFINTGDDDKVYYSDDDGATWTQQGTSSDNVWRKGWLADPNNDNLYAGGFQLNKSTDNGQNWSELYPQWWVYYGTSKDYLHVDMMNFDYYEKADGTPFILVCNHAGLHVSYDNFATTSNLGLSGLRVTTLYDQSTAADGFLYCGAQDKGTFTSAGTTSDFSIVDTDNRTTGDGMLGVFFNSDQSYYGMIQNGQFAVVPNRNASNKTWYTIPGNHKSGWINPVVGTFDFTDNKAYMAGGNLNGGDGCYLIEMDVTLNGNSVTFNPSQFNYDFRANSNSGTAVIKAIGVSEADASRLYVATQDGTFFYSEDTGSNWTKSAANLPSAFLPWEIITSATDADKVFISGTGNSNTGVYTSDDGGVTFTALSNNIPSATIFEVALNDDEELLFAATSDGPYVYIFEEAQWFSLMGADTPILDYNSVDNIGNDVIRFGTYGRGVWDFEIQSVILPAELADFSAKEQSDKTVLTQWQTLQEVNVSDFELEHAGENANFVSLKKISATNTQSVQNYRFTHKNPKSGLNYYRLKINDQDGSFSYSDIKSVRIKGTEIAMNVYPNPLAENGELFFKTEYATPFSVEIYDAGGKAVFVERQVEGTQSVLPKLTGGLYFYRIVGEDKLLKSGQLVVR